VFSTGDPYAGADLDDCRNPETGELEEWAAKIVQDLDGYAEVSPSGKGVHIIVRGKAPNKKRGKVEAYSSERYFTMTGQVL
jgi:putative DNA primase/helicase